MMSRCGSEKDQIEFMYKNVSNPDFRKRLIQRAWDKSDYDEVLRLAKEGVSHDKDYAGLVCDWNKWEYKVYQAIGDRTNEELLARHFFFTFRGSLWGENDYSMESMYSALKTLIPQNEWSNYVGNLIREAKDKSDWVHILFIYTQEKMWDEYMAYLREVPSLYNIDNAPKEVKELFKGEIIKLYASAVKKFFQWASSRNYYREGVDYLRTLIKYGGNKEAEQIISEQKSRTPRRPALIDELSKL